MNLADHMDWSELLIKNHSQPYVKFILYKREVLIKLRFIGKIIGFQGGTLRSTTQIAIGLLVPFIGTTLRFCFSIFVKERN